MCGGDWQFPVYYFKIQDKNRSWKSLSVFIPGKQEGNGNLENNGDEYRAIDNQKKHEDARNEDKAWSAVKRHLKNK